jgi:prolyl oligopeptidase
MPEPYPNARREIVEDTLTGISFPDPYRWLEKDCEEVRNWQKSQAKLAAAHAKRWPHYERLHELVSRFSTGHPDRSGALPYYAAGRWFRMRIPEGASQAQAIVANRPMGTGRVLFDPSQQNPERPPFLSWIAPSPDGATLALGVCTDGSENNTILLIDVPTGRVLPNAPCETLMDSWTGGVQWLPDSTGFFFSAITGAPKEFQQQVYLHRRAPAPTTTRLDIPWVGAQEYRMIEVSRDGRHAVALERFHYPIPVAVAALGGESLHWRSFIRSTKGTVVGHVVGDRYIAVTNVRAARGRLVAIELAAENPDDPDGWNELVPESSVVLNTVTPVGSVLYLTQFADTYSQVRVVDLDGNHLQELPLPARGAVAEALSPMMNVVPKGHPDRFLFSFSSLTASSGIYCHTPGHAEIETLQEPQVRLQNTEVEDHWATSKDGTRIPYHLVRRSDVNAHQPQPTLIYAYGGYNSPLLPQFPGPMAALVATGGVFVHAHLRGGAEFGLDWWHCGRMRAKQNCYDDLYAVAEDLIAKGRCTPRLLALTGASNGGLLAGVALTQRPDLWAVVVPRVPILDLIGACRDPYGRMAIMEEIANIEDPQEVQRLATISPYHLVVDGVRYPATLIEAGDTDPRCPAWHARKFTARLQAASAGIAPILLHVWENVGHGGATDKQTTTAESTEWLAFTLEHLGIMGLADA